MRHRFVELLIERTCLLDGHLGDRGILECCNFGLVIDDEDSFLFLSDDEVKLFNSFGD